MTFITPSTPKSTLCYNHPLLYKYQPIFSNPVLKFLPKGDKRSIRTRKLQDFAENCEKLLLQSRALLRNDQVSEVIFARGANYANPKEIWRFQFAQPFSKLPAENKFKSWKLMRSIKPEIFDTKKCRGKLHLLAKLRKLENERLLENFIQLPFSEYLLKGKVT